MNREDLLKIYEGIKEHGDACICDTCLDFAAELLLAGFDNITQLKWSVLPNNGSIDIMSYNGYCGTIYGHQNQAALYQHQNTNRSILNEQLKNNMQFEN